VALGVWLLAPLSARAEALRIGETIEVVPAATRKDKAEPQTLESGGDVFADDLINTGRSGKAGFEFLDKARFDVGPNSSARLDRFVFNPDRTAKEAAISMGLGLFRFISGGASQHGAYNLSTPHVTLGIRGTDLTIIVIPGQTTVRVDDGLVIACHRRTRRCLRLSRGGVYIAHFYDDGRTEGEGDASSTGDGPDGGSGGPPPHLSPLDDVAPIPIRSLDDFNPVFPTLSLGVGGFGQALRPLEPPVVTPRPPVHRPPPKVVATPGPVAGSGLPALVVSVAWWWRRQRRRHGRDDKH
jgi:hypothetical protein